MNFLYAFSPAVPPQLSSASRIAREIDGRVVEEGNEARPAGGQPQPVALRGLMVTRLRDSHGEPRAREILTVMSNPANGLSKPRAVCDAATAMYAAIADLPASEGGRLMRHLIGRQAVAPGEALRALRGS